MIHRILAITLVACSSALAGPFGFEMGMTKEQVADLCPIEESSIGISTSAPPNPHSAFDAYDLSFSAESGLCMVMASTPVFTSAGNAKQLMEKFYQLTAQLATKYGAPEIEVENNGGPFADNDEHQMLAMKLKQVAYAATYPRADQPALPDNLASIRVVPVALGPTQGFVVVLYTFENKIDLDEENRREDLDAL